MNPDVLSSACLVTGKPCRQAPHPADLRPPQASIWGENIDNLQIPLPWGELVSTRPAYARFPAQASCLKSQMRVQYIKSGLVQHGLCGGFAPHESFTFWAAEIFP